MIFKMVTDYPIIVGIKLWRKINLTVFHTSKSMNLNATCTENNKDLYNIVSTNRILHSQCFSGIQFALLG
jgi:hypothetical protein